MNGRIKELRKALGLSQDEFGAKLGVTRGAITNIELNKTEPKPLFIDLICNTFNVNPEWIRTGEGNMLEEKTRNEAIADFMVDLLKEEETSYKRRFIEMLSALSAEEWELLEKMARKMTE
jgi:transcriptional regulator with XRE-family HTH domain